MVVKIVGIISDGRAGVFLGADQRGFWGGSGWPVEKAGQEAESHGLREQIFHANARSIWV